MSLALQTSKLAALSQSASCMYQDQLGSKMSSAGEDSRVDSWKTPPTVENTLPSVPLGPPAIHAAIYNPNLTVEEVEAMVIAHPLCLGTGAIL